MGQKCLARYVVCQRPDKCCHSASDAQTILFTTEGDVLMRVALHDDVFFEEVGVVKESSEAVCRPTTADRTGAEAEVRPTTHALSADVAVVGQGVRSSLKEAIKCCVWNSCPPPGASHLG